MDECRHGLPKASCYSCKHPLRAPVRPTVEYTFTAKFDGRCGECNLPMRVGEVVARMSDERYVHEGCA